MLQRSLNARFHHLAKGGDESVEDGALDEHVVGGCANLAVVEELAENDSLCRLRHVRLAAHDSGALACVR